MSTKLDKKENNYSHQTTIQIIKRELIKDKAAMTSLIVLVLIIIASIVIPLLIDQAAAFRVNPRMLNTPPSAEHVLGTDDAGRDVFAFLVVGARNSLAVGFLVTLISGVFGIIYGLISGYFGGRVDNVMMRIAEFFSILPFLVLVITFVAIMPQYTIFHFALIMSSFLWMGIARMIRARSIQEKELEYIQASKTLGTSNLKIIFRELFPNVSTIMIANMTLNMAGNIGIEVGLTFLGFGFPFETPSLGTLLSAARNPVIMQLRWWIWVPALILVLAIMLSINSLGRMLNRATDSRLRRG